MDYSLLVEKNKQYNQLLSCYNLGTLTNAILLKSVDENLSKEIAFSLASKIVGASISLVKKKAHPDVLIYGLDGKIDAGAANEIVESLVLRPYSSSKKVYCLFGIENMNEISQNKILKSLEEPPEDVFFILTSANMKLVLSTVASRTNVVEIDAASNKDIFDMLVACGVDNDTANIAVSCSAGNSTLAEKLTDQKFVNLYNLVIDALENINGSRDCLTYASKFESKEIDKNEMLDIAIVLLRDASMVNANKDSLVVNAHHMGAIKNIASGLFNDSIATMISECLRLKQNLYYNGNTTAIVDKFVLMIAEEKSKCRK